jgi:1-acyl-sn-glycerol-3-phosphate acyltransferase
MLLTVFAILSALAAIPAGLGCEGLAWLWVAPLTFLGCFVGLLVLAFLFLWAVSSLVKDDTAQEKDDPFFRRLIEVYIEAILTVLRMKVSPVGLEKIPESGRFMIVCNHLSLLDVLVLLVYFPQRELTFVTKQENMDMFIIGKLMRKIQCLPLNRENDREALKTILKAIALIKEDKASVGLFPEGTRSLDGKLHQFRSGGFKIPQKSGVPIVVCTIQNTHKVFRNFLHLKSTPIPLHLLEVIPAEELKAVSTVDISGRVRDIMAADLGPDLVAEE